jgi:hypothetical protein
VILFDIGRIWVYRKLLKWEWFKDGNTLKLFIYIMLSANFKAAKWQGIELKPGQQIITFREVAEKCGLTMRQFRTSLNRLKTTHEITCESTHQYTLVTVANWALYQSDNGKETQQTTNETTNERHTNDTPTTHIEEGYKRRKSYTHTNKPDMEVCKQVVDEWNRTVPSLPQVKPVGEKRLNAIMKLYELVGCVEDISYGFSRVEGSDFLKGLVNEWKANFNWVIDIDNWQKITEGTYENKTSPKKGGSQLDGIPMPVKNTRQE